MKDYEYAFSKEEWRELHQIDKLRHTAVACKECAKRHVETFELKKNNISFIESVKTQEARTPQVLQPINVTIQRNEITPKQPITAENVPNRVKRQIINKARRKEEGELIQTNKKALFSEETSIRSYERQRMIAHSHHVQHPKKSHTGPVENYEFDRQRVREEFEFLSDENRDLGDNLNRRWTNLARVAGLRPREGKTLNAAQVCFHLCNHKFSIK